MQALLEQFASRKLGVAVVAMVLITQLPAGETVSALLIAGIGALHILCQTWLDLRNGHDTEDQPDLDGDGLLLPPTKPA